MVIAAIALLGGQIYNHYPYGVYVEMNADFLFLPQRSTPPSSLLYFNSFSTHTHTTKIGIHGMLSSDVYE